MHGMLAGWMIGRSILNIVVTLVFQRWRRTRKVETGDNIKSFIIVESISDSDRAENKLPRTVTTRLEVLGTTATSTPVVFGGVLRLSSKRLL